MKFEMAVDCSGDRAPGFYSSEEASYQLCGGAHAIILDKRSSGVEGGIIHSANTTYGIAVGGTEGKPAVIVPFRAQLDALCVSLDYRAQDSNRVKIVPDKKAGSKLGKLIYVANFEDAKCVSDDGDASSTPSPVSGAIALWSHPTARPRDVKVYCGLFAVAPGDKLLVWMKDAKAPETVTATARVQGDKLVIRDAPADTASTAPASERRPVRRSGRSAPLTHSISAEQLAGATGKRAAKR